MIGEQKKVLYLSRHCPLPTVGEGWGGVRSYLLSIEVNHIQRRIMNKKLRVILSLLVIFSMLLAACGGGEEPTATPEPAAPAAEAATNTPEPAAPTNTPEPAAAEPTKVPEAEPAAAQVKQ